LMVRHNLGAKPVQSYIFKELDIGYFSTRERNSAPLPVLQLV
jgi:hypothetical protein